MSNSRYQRRQLLTLPFKLACLSAASAYVPAIWSQQETTADFLEIKIALIEGLSGPFGNAGDGVYRNLLLSTERINAAGGIIINGQPHLLRIIKFDSQGNMQNALSQLKSAIDQNIHIIAQGNSSAIAEALISAIEKHNMRLPVEQHNKRLIFLNYSAVETTLTNEKCSFWHFRFDANADMRLQALFQVLKNDQRIQRIFLIGQDYNFGRYVLQRSQEMIAQIRPDIEIVGQILHPVGQVKDFIPYATRIKASGAQAVITGNWGNDLSMLVRSARDIGLHDIDFYTFYANDLGTPTAMGEAGVGRALAVIEWHPNAGALLSDEKARTTSDAFYLEFIQRFPNPQDHFIRLRMQIMLEMLAQAIETAQTTDAQAIALALEGMQYDNGFHQGVMRREDHQFQQILYVMRMQKAGTPDVPFANEGSSYGFRTELRLMPEQIEIPSSCQMQR